MQSPKFLFSCCCQSSSINGSTYVLEWCLKWCLRHHQPEILSYITGLVGGCWPVDGEAESRMWYSRATSVHWIWRCELLNWVPLTILVRKEYISKFAWLQAETEFYWYYFEEEKLMWSRIFFHCSVRQVCNSFQYCTCAQVPLEFCCLVYFIECSVWKSATNLLKLIQSRTLAFFSRFLPTTPVKKIDRGHPGEDTMEVKFCCILKKAFHFTVIFHDWKLIHQFSRSSISLQNPCTFFPYLSSLSIAVMLQAMPLQILL